MHHRIEEGQMEAQKLFSQEVDGWESLWEQVKKTPEDLTERDKRYGRVFDVFDEELLFVVRMYLPQKTPHHPWVYRYGFPTQLSPYKVSAQVIDEDLVIRGVMQDENLHVLCGLINSFPDRFELKIPITFEVKNLEIQTFEDYIVDIKVTKQLSQRSVTHA